MKKTWILTPRYLCRKAVVLKFLDEIKKEKFLEVGMGAGDLILELAKRKLKNINNSIRTEKKIYLK